MGVCGGGMRGEGAPDAASMPRAHGPHTQLFLHARAHTGASAPELHRTRSHPPCPPSPPSQGESIHLFVAIVPVCLDTWFKYWIFVGLNKEDPAAAVTLRQMDRH